MDFGSRSKAVTGTSAGRPKIVLADDSALARHSVSRALSSMGQVSLVAVCDDGESAVEAALKHQADVVVLDIRMSGMDGYETARIIRSCTPTTAIVMTSIEDSPQVRATCTANGADAFVSKADFAREFPAAMDRALQAASADSRYRESEIRTNEKFHGASVLASAGCMAVQ